MSEVVRCAGGGGGGGAAHLEQLHHSMRNILNTRTPKGSAIK